MRDPLGIVIGNADSSLYEQYDDDGFGEQLCYEVTPAPSSSGPLDVAEGDAALRRFAPVDDEVGSTWKAGQKALNREMAKIRDNAMLSRCPAVTHDPAAFDQPMILPTLTKGEASLMHPTRRAKTMAETAPQRYVEGTTEAPPLRTSPYKRPSAAFYRKALDDRPDIAAGEQIQGAKYRVVGAPQYGTIRRAALEVPSSGELPRAVAVPGIRAAKSGVPVRAGAAPAGESTVGSRYEVPTARAAGPIASGRSSIPTSIGARAAAAAAISPKARTSRGALLSQSLDPSVRPRTTAGRVLVPASPDAPVRYGNLSTGRGYLPSEPQLMTDPSQRPLIPTAGFGAVADEGTVSKWLIPLAAAGVLVVALKFF